MVPIRFVSLVAQHALLVAGILSLGIERELCMNIVRIVAGVVVLAAALLPSASLRRDGIWQRTSPMYSVVSHIAGSGKSWDYAVIDEASSRFYVAQQGVTALDLKTGKLITGLVPGKTTHGLAVLGDGTLAVDDAANKDRHRVFNGARRKR